MIVTGGGVHWPAPVFENAAAAGWPNAIGSIQADNIGIYAQGIAAIGIVEGVPNTNRGAWWGEQQPPPPLSGSLSNQYQ